MSEFMKKYDYLIIGAGLFGSTFAYEMTKKGKKCLVIDTKYDTIQFLFFQEIFVNFLIIFSLVSIIFSLSYTFLFIALNVNKIFNKGKVMKQIVNSTSCHNVLPTSETLIKKIVNK